MANRRVRLFRRSVEVQAHTTIFDVQCTVIFWDKRAMFWNCTRCPKLSPLSGEVVIQCGTIWSPKGFDISRLCHSNLSRSEDHSFLESSAKKGSPAVNLLLLLCSTIWNYILIFRLDTIWQEKNLLIFEKHLPNYEIIWHDIFRSKITFDLIFTSINLL